MELIERLKELATICADMKPVGQWPGSQTVADLREAADRIATLERELAEARKDAAALREAAQAFPKEPNPYTYRMAYAKLKAAIAAAGEDGK